MIEKINGQEKLYDQNREIVLNVTSVDHNLIMLSLYNSMTSRDRLLSFALAIEDEEDTKFQQIEISLLEYLISKLTIQSQAYGEDK
jgi:hypothetical protein